MKWGVKTDNESGVIVFKGGDKIPFFRNCGGVVYPDGSRELERLVPRESSGMFMTSMAQDVGALPCPNGHPGLIIEPNEFFVPVDNPSFIAPVMIMVPDSQPRFMVIGAVVVADGLNGILAMDLIGGRVGAVAIEEAWQRHIGTKPPPIMPLVEYAERWVAERGAGSEEWLRAALNWVPWSNREAQVLGELHANGQPINPLLSGITMEIGGPIGILAETLNGAMIHGAMSQSPVHADVADEAEDAIWSYLAGVEDSFPDEVLPEIIKDPENLANVICMCPLNIQTSRLVKFAKAVLAHTGGDGFLGWFAFYLWITGLRDSAIVCLKEGGKFKGVPSGGAEGLTRVPYQGKLIVEFIDECRPPAKWLAGALERSWDFPYIFKAIVAGIINSNNPSYNRRNWADDILFIGAHYHSRRSLIVGQVKLIAKPGYAPAALDVRRKGAYKSEFTATTIKSRYAQLVKAVRKAAA